MIVSRFVKNLVRKGGREEGEKEKKEKKKKEKEKEKEGVSEKRK